MRYATTKVNAIVRNPEVNDRNIRQSPGCPQREHSLVHRPASDSGELGAKPSNRGGRDRDSLASVALRSNAIGALARSFRHGDDGQRD